MNKTITNVKRCARCGGRCQVIGMGMIKHDCPECHAVGYIEEKVIDVPPAVLDIPKRRGRRPAKQIDMVKGA